MDKSWDENYSKSEVIGHCGGDEHTEWPHISDTVKCEQKWLWIADYQNHSTNADVLASVINFIKLIF